MFGSHNCSPNGGMHMAERKYTEAQKKSAKKWDAENLDRMSIAIPKGMKNQIKEHATQMGDKSANAFINRAIAETMDRDKSGEDTE